MVDFSKLLTPEARARLAARQQEVLRLFSLPDRWLAKEIIGMARRVRDFYPDSLGQAAHVVQGATYDTTFVWDLVPEIAARLGHQDFLPGERSAEIRALGQNDLREWVGITMQWLSQRTEDYGDFEREVHPWDLLTTTFVNGNPVVIGLDRVAPAGPSSEDWCARHMREVARIRGFGDEVTWCPDFNVKRSQIAESESVEVPTP